MAGAEEQNPSMTTDELVSLIKQVKKIPVERDTLYNEIRNFGATGNERHEVSNLLN
jgi:aminodeoxyfutalosine synthase